MKGASNITAPPFVNGAFNGGVITSAITPPNNSAALQSPTRSNSFYFWDGHPSIHGGSNVDVGFHEGVTVGVSRSIGFSSTNTAHSAWRDTGLKRGASAGVLEPLTDDSHDLGSASARFDDIYATNTTIQSSARQLKEDIQACPLGLEFIKALNPVVYRWSEQTYQDEVTDAEGNKSTVERVKPAGTRYHAGLIADEVAAALDAAGIGRDKVAAYINPAATGREGHEGLRYIELFAPLLKAVQELSAKVEALENAA